MRSVRPYRFRASGVGHRTSPWHVVVDNRPDSKEGRRGLRRDRGHRRRDCALGTLAVATAVTCNEKGANSIARHGRSSRAALTISSSALPRNEPKWLRTIDVQEQK
jgi:hypothetical protein